MVELVVPSIDFSPLGELGKVYADARDAANQKRTLAQLGQGGDDADILLKSSNMNLIQMGQNMRNRQNDMMLRQQDIERSQGNTDRDYALRVRAQNRADEGPGVAVGQRAKMAEQYGLKPGTPEFQQYVLGGSVPQTSVNSVEAQVEQRKRAAASLGMTPDHPAYQSYVATGKMPREDAQPLTATDKKAILEADEHVLTNKTAIENLNLAKDLSKKSYEGPMAKDRGYVASLFGSEAGTNTTKLDNVVQTNALGQLKSIFGGNPTEGERNILLEIQGSSNQPDAVRQDIYNRAIELAKKRLEFNEKRAGELRGGNYYKPQGSMTRAPVKQTQGITQADYENLPSGSVFTAPDGTQRVKP